MKFLRRAAVMEKTGVKNSQLYKKIAEGTFPAPIRTGERQVAWLESELDAWIEQKIAERHDHEPLVGGTPRGTKRVAK
jgi:prophage regulatory protein